VSAADNAQPEAEPEAHDCSGPECHPYPTFDDDPARWGFQLEPEMTDAELEAAALADAWGPAGPFVEPEAEL
jgi:hypothetical protein